MLLLTVGEEEKEEEEEDRAVIKTSETFQTHLLAGNRWKGLNSQ